MMYYWRACTVVFFMAFVSTLFLSMIFSSSSSLFVVALVCFVAFCFSFLMSKYYEGLLGGDSL